MINQLNAELGLSPAKEKEKKKKKKKKQKQGKSFYFLLCTISHLICLISQ